MALITTFATTPLTSALYPRWYQIKLASWKRGEIDWDGNRLTPDGGSSEADDLSLSKAEGSGVNRVLTYLRLDSMSGVIAFVSLLARPRSSPSAATKVHPSKKNEVLTQPSQYDESITQRPLQVHGIRLVELTDRASSVMKVSEVDETTSRDPIINTFRTVGQLRQFSVSGAVMVVPETSYATTLVERATDVAADLVLIPWSESGAMSENSLIEEGSGSRFANGSFSHYVSSALKQTSHATIAIFIDNGFGSRRRTRETRTLSRTVSAMSAKDMRSNATIPVTDQGHHIFLPFFGSEDDKAALRFVLQLAQDSSVTATICHFELPDSIHDQIASNQDSKSHAHTPGATAEELKSPISITVNHASASHYATFFALMRDSLPSTLASRVIFTSTSLSTSASPIADVLSVAKKEVGISTKNAGDLVVLGRNAAMRSVLSAAGATFDNHLLFENEAEYCLGGVAEGVIKNGTAASLMVLKASGKES